MEVLWRAMPKRGQSYSWDMLFFMLFIQFIFGMFFFPLSVWCTGALDGVACLILGLFPLFWWTPFRLRLQYRWTSFSLTADALVEEIKIGRWLLHRRRFSLNQAQRPFLRIASPCVGRDGAYFSVSFGNISQYDTPFHLLLLSFRQSRCSDGAGLYADFYGLIFDDVVRLLKFFPQHAFYYPADCVEVERAVKVRAVNFETTDACGML